MLNWWRSPLVIHPDYLVTLDDFTFERHWVTKGRRHQLSLHALFGLHRAETQELESALIAN